MTLKIIYRTVFHVLLHQNWTPVRPKKKQRYIQIYPRYIQDIQDKYKIPSGTRPGPARAKPGAARSRRLVFCFILDILDTSWIYLDVFLVHVYVCSGGLGSNLYEMASNEQVRNCHMFCFTKRIPKTWHQVESMTCLVLRPKQQKK